MATWSSRPAGTAKNGASKYGASKTMTGLYRGKPSAAAALRFASPPPAAAVSSDAAAGAPPAVEARTPRPTETGGSRR